MLKTSYDIETLRTKMEATEHKINLLDTVAGTLIGGLLVVAVIVLPMLAH